MNHHDLEGLDFRIMKLLLANNGAPPEAPLRRSFRSMAKDLGVDQGTIRARTKKLQEQRVLKGWYLGVSPSVTAHDIVYAWLIVEPGSSKDDVIGRLLTSEEVERVFNYLGPKLSLVVLCKSGTSPELALQNLAREAGLGNAIHEQACVRVPGHELSRTDVEIVEILRGDPWKSYSDVATLLRLSAKTVKRRVTNLAEAGVIYMIPIIDLKALQGIVPMELLVEYTSAESKAGVNTAVMSRVKENLVFSDTSAPFGYFALAVPNVVHVEQIAEWVRKQSGVKDVRSEALIDVVLNRNYYERTPRFFRPELEGERVLT
jgi:DNA-binding Lrp family transcriptional regulator